MQPATHTAQIDNYRINYWTYGNPKKQPVLFVHGFTGSNEGFQYIVPQLQHDFYLIVPDLPGFGASELGSDTWGIDEIARRANEFAKSLKLPHKPHVVAHSMGGVVAASMLSQNPHLYQKKAVFISPHVQPVKGLRVVGAALQTLQYSLGTIIPVLGPKFVKSRLYSRIATKLIMTTKKKTLKKAIYRHHFRNLEFISSIGFYYNLHREIIKTGALRYANALRNFRVLIVTGNKDAVTPLATQKRFQTALAATLKVIPGVGHLLHYEKPTEVAAALREFLQP
ncbi:alpha/beta hydrolase [Candidatus Saccharibacteria bacterium]|nr:alpha/beta hydrolase [Candidatus Saccharibacteria bacterium]